MTKLRIEIEEMRISSDGQFLEFIFNCPDGYKFDTFLLQVVGTTDVYDLSEAVFTEDLIRVIGSIPVAFFKVTKPEIYEIKLAAKNVVDEDDVLEETIFISDVKDVYDCLMRDIKALDAKCMDEEIQNRVIRNYLILYAHQEALHHQEVKEAVRWFNMMKNCFSGLCESPHEGPDCGCGHHRAPIEHNNCGCKK